MKDILNNLFIPKQLALTNLTRGYIDEFGKPRCLGAKNVKEYDTVKNTPIRNTLVGKIDMRFIGTASVPYNSIAITGTSDSIQNCKCYIKLSNFFAIIPHTTIVNGAIQEELIEGYYQGEAYYIPKDSNFYKNSIEYTASRFAAVDSEKPVKVNKFSNSNLIPGHVYRKRNGDIELFAGKHKIFITEQKKVYKDDFTSNRSKFAKEGWLVFPFETGNHGSITVFRHVLRPAYIYWSIRQQDSKWPSKDILKTRTAYYFTSARSYCEDMGEHLTQDEINEVMKVAMIHSGYHMGCDGTSWKNPIIDFQIESMAPEDGKLVAMGCPVATEYNFPCEYTLKLYTEPNGHFTEWDALRTFTFRSNSDMLKFLKNPHECYAVRNERTYIWEWISFAELITKYNLKKCKAYRQDNSCAFTWFNWNASQIKM